MPMIKTIGSLVKKAFKDSAEGPNLLNAYTGKELKKSAAWAMGLGIAGGAAAAGYGSVTATKYGVGADAKTKQMGTIDYSGNIPDMLYDGRANINKMTGQYDLGADGDLVLSMSANRKKARRTGVI